MNYIIAIVDYNKRKSVEALIAQLLAQSLPPSSIRIVDNAAQDIPGRYHSIQDGSCIGNTAVSIIIPEKNLGYSKGCNLAAAGLANEEFVVFLSPDIEVRDPAFFESFFAGIAGLDRVGCIGVAQRNPDGSYEQVPRKLPTLVGMMGRRLAWVERLFPRLVADYMSAYEAAYSPGAAPLTVEWMQSSFLAIPAAVWKKFQGFDERYYIFMADVDFGLRCLKQGLHSYFLPSFLLHADGIRASGGTGLAMFKSPVFRIHVLDAMKYFLRHFSSTGMPNGK